MHGRQVTSPADKTHRLDTDNLAEVELREEQEPPSAPQPPSSSRRGAVVAAGAAGVVLIGLAVWALLLRSDRNDARSQLAALEKENVDLQDALELHRSTKIKLDNSLAACKDERDTEKQAVEEGRQQLTKTEMSLQVCQTAKSGLEDQTEEVRERLAELDRLTGRFKQMVDTGDLSVQIRRGQMVVKLPSAVLFPSGKAELSDRGKKTLDKVAAILATLPRRKFTVAGHTDSRPVRKGQFDNNWELSAARSVRVTTQLIAAGVKPKNLVAAGYGPYAPVATNKTKRGRQLNRRIEIILEPDLQKLPASVMADGKTRKKSKRKR